MTIDDVEKFHAHMTETARSIAPSLGENDDWIPIAVCVTEEKRVVSTVLPTKEGFAPGAAISVCLEKLIAGVQPAMIAVVFTAWMVNRDSTTVDPRTVRASQEPDRREILCIALSSKSHGFELSIAEITRRKGQHPLLGPWEHEPSSTETGGRIADAMKRALAM